MNVYLISQIGGWNSDIVSHFFNYYKKLGVDEFLITFHVDKRNISFIKNIYSLINEYNITDFCIFTDTWSHKLKGDLNRKLLEKNLYKIKNEDWILRADQDEFHKYPGNMKLFLSECNKKKYEYIQGGGIDRINKDFPAITPECVLNDLFPIKDHVVESLNIKKKLYKIMAAKKNVEVDHSAFHIVNNEYKYKKLPEDLTYDHFKWDKSVFDRLEERLRLNITFNADIIIKYLKRLSNNHEFKKLQ